MKETVVGIIGGTHGMGCWFARLLRNDDYKVHVCGRKTRLGIDDLARLCHVVVVAVPIAATAEVIKQVGPLMSSGSLLMDLTSIKKEPVELMLASSRADVIGCHPLFGPSLKNVRGQNVILCPARADKKWLSWLKKLLVQGGFVVTEKTPAEHDKMMAFVQVLNHLNTISLGLTLAATGIPLAEIKKFSTPIFKTKVEIVKKIFTENPALYADILTQNHATKDIIGLYKKSLAEISVLIRSGDRKKMQEMMEKAAGKLFC